MIISRFRNRLENKKKISNDVNYALEFYKHHPNQIDYLIRVNDKFYEELRKSWGNIWYCKRCKIWLDKSIKQCKCGQWQNLYYEYLSYKDNAVDKCFNILRKHFKHPYNLINIYNENNILLTSLIQGLLTKNCIEVQNAMRLYLLKIMEHLNISPEEVDIKIEIEDEDELNEVVGSYSVDSNWHRSIIVRLRYSYLPDTCIAIACHECMHHFLLKNSVRVKSKKDNEVLTDLATIFFGMGYITIDGYRIYNKSKGDCEYKFGYMSPKQAKYALALYNKERDEYQRVIRTRINDKIKILSQKLQYCKEKGLVYNDKLSQEEKIYIQKGHLYFVLGECDTILNKLKKFIINHYTSDKEIRKNIKLLDENIEYITKYKNTIDSCIQ